MTKPLVPWSGGRTYRLPFLQNLLDQVDCSELAYIST